MFQTLTGYTLDPLEHGFASIDAMILQLSDKVELRYIGNRTTRLFPKDDGQPIGNDMLVTAALPQVHTDHSRELGLKK